MSNLFEELELKNDLMRAIREMGFTEMTDIQAQAIPVMRSGRDMIGRSQTGTGKTIAFGIPAVERIDPEDHAVQVLILSPTRELAEQAAGELRKLCAYLPYIHVTDVYGGTSMDRQFAMLHRANLVIGTPGRIMDHMRRETLKLDGLKLLILDEADEMLDMGFREDIETILKDAPENRQTVLFSATMPQEILDITEQFQRDPELIEINKEQMTLDAITQYYTDLPLKTKDKALLLLLHYYQPKRAMIFTNTKTMTDDLTDLLQKRGFQAESLHGDMKQQSRSRVMQAFKSGKLSILIATDVAARGIDVNDVDYVINYDLPHQAEPYVHRIGRTGRAGKTGISISLVSGRRQLHQMEQLGLESHSELHELKVPTVAEIRAHQEEAAKLRMRELSEKEPEEACLLAVRELMAEGIPAENIAAALAHFCFEDRTEGLEDIVYPEKKPSRRDSAGLRNRRESDREKFADIMLDIGKRNDVRPNHIVGSITEKSGIAGAQIGKISIHDDYTVVGVDASCVNDVLMSLGDFRICGKPIHALLVSVPEKEGEKRERKLFSRRKDRDAEKTEKPSEERAERSKEESLNETEGSEKESFIRKEEHDGGEGRRRRFHHGEEDAEEEGSRRRHSRREDGETEEEGSRRRHSRREDGETEEEGSRRRRSRHEGEEAGGRESREEGSKKRRMSLSERFSEWEQEREKGEARKAARKKEQKEKKKNGLARLEQFERSAEREAGKYFFGKNSGEAFEKKGKEAGKRLQKRVPKKTVRMDGSFR